METPKDIKITWKINKTTPVYNEILKQCNLCLEQKIAIITFPGNIN